MATTIDFDFTKGKRLENYIGPLMTYSAPSERYMEDDLGWWRRVGYNSIRYKQGQHQANFLPYSNDFTNAQWVVVNGQKGTESTVAPNGETETVSWLGDDDVDTNVRLQNAFYSNDEPNRIYRYEFVLKKRGTNGNWVLMSEPDAGDQVYFNIGTGATGGASGFPADSVRGEGVGYGIEAMPNGWYKIWMLSEGVDPNPRINLYVAESDGDVGITDPDLSWSVYIYEAAAVDVSGRYAENLNPISNSFTVANNWVHQASISLISDDGEVGPGGDGPATATSFDFSGATNGQGFYRTMDVTHQSQNQYYICSGWIKGSADCTVLLANPANSSDQQDLEITTEWRRFEIPMRAVSPAGMGMWVRRKVVDFVCDTIYVAGFQLERKSPNVTTASIYRPTTGTGIHGYEVASNQLNSVHSGATFNSEMYGQCEGYYFEENATNLLLHNRDITNVAWTKTNASPVLNHSICPEGFEGSMKLVDNAATGTGAVNIKQTVTVTADTAYVASVWINRQLDPEILLEIQGSGAQTIGAYFNANTVTVNETGFANNNYVGMIDRGDGWYQCYVAFTQATADTSLDYVIHMTDGNRGLTVNLDGSTEIALWMPQLETGQYPTTPIRTTTAAASRSSDDLTYNNTNLANYIRNDRGTMVCDVTLYDLDHLGFFCGYTTSNNHQIRFFYSTAEQYNFTSVGPTNVIAQTTSAGLQGTDIILAGSWQKNYARLAYNGTLSAAADTTVDELVGTPSQLGFGNNTSGTGQGYGIMRRATFIDEPVSDSELQQVSAGTLDAGMLGDLEVLRRKKQRDRFRRRYRRT